MVRELYLDPKWSIFKYHFKDEPILPGGLMIDFLFPDILTGVLITGYFHKKCTPCSLITISEKSPSKIRLEIGEQLVARFGLNYHPYKNKLLTNFENISYNIAKENLEFRHAKEIVYLDGISNEIIKREEKYIGYGTYRFNKSSFFLEISDNYNFGISYILLEFLGFTCLGTSRLIFSDINIEGYIFGYIKNFCIYNIPHNGEQLYARVELKRIGSDIIWSGEIFSKQKEIATVDEVISICKE